MQVQFVPFPPATAFPKNPPKGIRPWVWEKFLEMVSYREYRLEQALPADPGTRFAHFLGHEIKRAEIDIGLWLGRMKEAEHETD